MALDGTRRAMFVAALARGSTVSDAAEAAGVSKRTASRWFNAPDVRAELDRLRRATLCHARERLLGLVDRAADTLDEVMAGSLTDSARVSAARTVLAQAIRIDDHVELEERLVRVEQVIEMQQAAQERRWPA